MKSVNLKPYVIFGIVAAIVAIPVMPLMDMLMDAGKTYVQGLTDICTYIFAAAFGASLSFAVYRGDKNK